MKNKTCKFLAAAAVLALGFANTAFVSQAAGTVSGNWDDQLVRQMDQLEQRMDAMERRMDRDMTVQRQFFNDWMDHSMVMPDPFARIWQDKFQSLENMQTMLSQDGKGNGSSSGLQFTGTDGSLMQFSTWGNGIPADTDISYAVSNQTIAGDVTADGNSSLKLVLRDKTYFKGALNKDKTARAVSVSLDKEAVWDVTGTSYVTAFTDEDTTLANVHSNGYDIYYNGDIPDNAWLKGAARNLPGGGRLLPEVQKPEVQQAASDSRVEKAPKADTGHTM